MLFDDTPRGIMEALLVAGGVALALSTAPTLFMALAAVGYVIKAEDRAKRRRLQRSFQYLMRNKYVTKDTTGKGARIGLTVRGKTRIMRHIRERTLLVPINRPKVWDRRWRIILFDIPTAERSKRNAFRALIRRLGAVMLQKSVWIYPFDCSEQVSILKSMFNFSDHELRIVVGDTIGDDEEFRRHFRV